MPAINLTPTNDSIVTSQAPRSSVTQEQIAAPYKEFGDSLTKLGGAVDDVAVRMAHEAAQNAVTRDENGKLQIQQVPLLVGRAADEYARVANESYLSQLDPEIQTQITQARVKNEGNPAEFAAWSKTYVQELASSQPTPELRNAVTTMAMRHSSESYNGLLVRQGQREVGAAKDGIAASQSQIENELSALALQGADINSAPIQGRIADWTALSQQRAANPLYGYSTAQQQYDQGNFLGKLQANSFIAKTQDVQKNQGFDDRLASRSAVSITRLHLPTRTSSKILRSISLRISAMACTTRRLRKFGRPRPKRKRDLGEAQRAANEAMLAASRGTEISPELEQQITQQLRDGGGAAASARFSAAIMRSRQIDSFNLPLSEMRDTIGFFARGGGAAASPDVRAAITDAAAQTGVSPEYLFRTAGKESSFKPAAAGQGSSAAGLFQFTDRTWADMLAKHGAQYGLGPNTPKTDATASALMAGELTKENAKALSDAGLPVNESTLYVAHFAGSGGATRLMTADPNAVAAGVLPEAAAASGNKSIFYDSAGQPRTVGQALTRLNAGFGGPEPGVIVGAVDPRMVTSMQEVARKRGTTHGRVVAADMDKGTRPADGVVNQIVDAAKIGGDQGLLETIGARLDRFDMVKNEGTLGLPQQAARITELERAASQGQSSPGNSALLKDFIARKKQIEDGLDKNAVSLTVSNFGSRFQTPAPLDVANPENFQAGLQSRLPIAQFASHNWQVPARSVLDEADVRSVRAALDQSTADGKLKIFSAFSVLPEAERNATLARLGDKGATAATEVFAGAMMNDAPAKTQAALFEVMEERQITVDGQSYPLQPPFMVVATQNPIEQEGTYHLPEAQLDRFLFKINVDYPTHEQEFQVVMNHHKHSQEDMISKVVPVMSAASD